MNASNTFQKLLQIIILFLALFCFYGCENNGCPTCSDGDWNDSNNIFGSGNVVTMERELPAFHSIKHTTVGQVNLTYGDMQEVLITTDDNIHAYVKTNVVNSELIISIKAPKGLSNFDLTFDIVVPEIRKLTTSSAGNIEGQNKFYGEKITLVLLSAGNISLDIEADELHSSLYSAGNLFLKGHVNEHIANLYSAGNLSAFSLSSDTTYITLNSAGNGSIKVESFLDATLNSAGSLYYLGHPEIIQRVSSIGRIFNAN